MKISNKNLIQSYVITKARYDFSIYEKRILYNIIESLQELTKGKKLNQRYSIEEDLFGDYAMTYDISIFLDSEKDKNYERIKTAFKALKNKSFEYEDEKEWEYISIIETPKIIKYNSKVKFRLNKRIFNAFLDFSKGFRKYELNTAMQFKSVYAMRFYELFSNKNEPIIYSISELKEMFKIQQKYKLVADFLRRVINPAKKELDKFSPYSFCYEPIKKGRKITHIKFKPYAIKKNIDIGLEKKKLSSKISMHWDLNAETVKYLKDTFDFTDKGLKNNRELLKKFVQSNNFRNRCSEINGMIRKYYIKNPTGFFISQIKKHLNEG